MSDTQNNTGTPINFAQMAAGLQAAEVAGGGITIRAGRCPEGAVPALLGAWRGVAALPFGLWEEFGAVRLDRDALPPTVFSLLRACLFGPGGDLDLRRTGGEFRWRFVGPGAAPLPPAAYAGTDFWQEAEHANVTFLQSSAAYLLWGKAQGGGLWAEDRVAAAHLRYPVDPTWDRVVVNTRLFSRGGQVEFVWHEELEAYRG